MQFPIWFLVTLCLLSGCDIRKDTPINTPKPRNVSLQVFAAASLSDAFIDIAAVFEEEWPNVDIQFHFAGSQQLAQQLRLGAPADVFASANKSQMDLVVQSGIIAPGTSTPFAHNQLSVIIPVDNPANVQTLEELSRPGLLIVLADEAVPIGQYSRTMLENASRAFYASFRQDVLDNVVSYEQNVRAVLTKVALGEADAGVVYLSNLVDESTVTSLLIPPGINTEATYPIAQLLESKHPQVARAFISFVCSEEGQRILEQYGFNLKNPV